MAKCKGCKNNFSPKRKNYVYCPKCYKKIQNGKSASLRYDAGLKKQYKGYY